MLWLSRLYMRTCSNRRLSYFGLAESRPFQTLFHLWNNMSLSPNSSFFLVSEILFPRNLLTSKIYPSLSPLVLSLTRTPTPLQLMINKMSVVARLRWSFSGWEIDDLSPMLIQVRGYGAMVIHISGWFANSHSTFMIVMTENGPERYFSASCRLWFCKARESQGISPVFGIRLILFILLCWAMFWSRYILFFLALSTHQSFSCLMAWQGMDPDECSYLQWVQCVQAGAVSLCCNTDNALLGLLSYAACCIP